jgi:hypothetical protein
MPRYVAIALAAAFIGLSACAHSVVENLDALEANLTGIAVMDMDHKSTMEVESGRKYVCDARQAYAKGKIAEAKRLADLAQEQVNAAQMKQWDM